MKKKKEENKVKLLKDLIVNLTRVMESCYITPDGIILSIDDTIIDKSICVVNEKYKEVLNELFFDKCDMLYIEDIKKSNKTMLTEYFELGYIFRALGKNNEVENEITEFINRLNEVTKWKDLKEFDVDEAIIKMIKSNGSCDIYIDGEEITIGKSIIPFISENNFNTDNFQLATGVYNDVIKILFLKIQIPLFTAYISYPFVPVNSQ